jgi:hypothetical protein
MSLEEKDARRLIVENIKFSIINHNLWNEEECNQLEIYFQLFIETGQEFTLNFKDKYCIHLIPLGYIEIKKPLYTN